MKACVIKVTKRTSRYTEVEVYAGDDPGELEYCGELRLNNGSFEAFRLSLKSREYGFDNIKWDESEVEISP